MRKILFCFTFIFVLSLHTTVAQWTKIPTLPNLEFVSLTHYNNALFAATLSNLIYTSSDSGETWNELKINDNNVIVEHIEFIDSVLFVGTTSSGIYESKNFGQTFTKTFQFTLPVTDFVKRENTIYAASQGNGIYVRGATSNEWSEFNSSLPLNVAGSVSNILTTQNNLFIASGANGVFHRYSFLTNEWISGTYYGVLSPGLLISDAINSGDTIFVVNGNRVIVSTNDGQTWRDDKLGTMNGVDRLIYTGKTDIFLITNDLQFGISIQKRKKHSLLGESWANDEEYIPNFYCFDIIEYDNRIYLASENGVYYKSIVTSVSPKEQIENENNFQVNIVSDILKIHSSKDIDHVTIYNTIGQIIYHNNIHSSSASLKTNLPSGVYGMKIVFTDGLFSINTILIE